MEKYQKIIMSIYSNQFIMRTIIIFSFCCIGCLLLTSCERTYCPAFPEHLIGYCPYKIGDTLSFVNQHNDTLSFCVEKGGATKEWSYGSNCKCSCGSPSASIHAPTLSRNFSLFWEITVTGYAAPFIKFELNSYNWDSGALYKGCLLYLYDETGRDPFDPKNSTFFGDTVIIEDKGQLISRVTAINGKGITGFYDQINNFQWKSIK